MILKLLEKLGRKYAFVDFYGDVLFYRYYLFFYEDYVDSRWIAQLPNVYIHIYPGDKNGDGPNIEGSHSHPWSTLGFIMRGGYTELVDEKAIRTTARWGLAPLSHQQVHKIIKVIPGTISIFMHWFRKSHWSVSLKTCEKICETCSSTNGGICNKTNTTRELDDHLQHTHDSVSDGRSWRAVTLLKVDNQFYEIISRRKKSLQRLGIKIPETLKEKAQVVKIKQIEKRNENQRII